MAILINTLEARTKIGKLVEEISKTNERYLISKRGKPSAVLLSINDFLKNIVKGSKIVLELENESKIKGKDKLTLKNINKEIRAFRRARN